MKELALGEGQFTNRAINSYPIQKKREKKGKNPRRRLWILRQARCFTSREPDVWAEARGNQMFASSIGPPGEAEARTQASSSVPVQERLCPGNEVLTNRPGPLTPSSRLGPRSCQRRGSPAPRAGAPSTWESLAEQTDRGRLLLEWWAMRLLPPRFPGLFEKLC